MAIIIIHINYIDIMINYLYFAGIIKNMRLKSTIFNADLKQIAQNKKANLTASYDYILVTV